MKIVIYRIINQVADQRDSMSQKVFSYLKSKLSKKELAEIEKSKSLSLVKLSNLNERYIATQLKPYPQHYAKTIRNNNIVKNSAFLDNTTIYHVSNLASDHPIIPVGIQRILDLVTVVTCVCLFDKVYYKYEDSETIDFRSAFNSGKDCEDTFCPLTSSKDLSEIGWETFNSLVQRIKNLRSETNDYFKKGWEIVFGCKLPDFISFDPCIDAISSNVPSPPHFIHKYRELEGIIRCMDIRIGRRTSFKSIAEYLTCATFNSLFTYELGQRISLIPIPNVLRGPSFYFLQNILGKSYANRHIVILRNLLSITEPGGLIRDNLDFLYHPISVPLFLSVFTKEMKKTKGDVIKSLQNLRKRTTSLREFIRQFLDLDLMESHNRIQKTKKDMEKLLKTSWGEEIEGLLVFTTALATITNAPSWVTVLLIAVSYRPSSRLLEKLVTWIRKPHVHILLNLQHYIKKQRLEQINDMMVKKHWGKLTDADVKLLHRLAGVRLGLI